MNRVTRILSLSAAKITPQHIQLFLLILALSLFVLGAGAPGDTIIGGR